MDCTLAALWPLMLGADRQSMAARVANGCTAESVSLRQCCVTCCDEWQRLDAGKRGMAACRVCTLEAVAAAMHCLEPPGSGVPDALLANMRRKVNASLRSSCRIPPHDRVSVQPQDRHAAAQKPA